MAGNRLYDVFLSHTSADKDAVEAIARRLEDEATLSPFLDKWHLIPGNPWQEELEQALDTSRTCAVFIGPHGIGPWENVEMRSALDDRVKRPGFRVIPVLLPGAVLPERGTLPRFLSSLTWVDCRSGLQDAEAFRRLVAGIRGQPPGRAREYVHGAHPPPPDDQLPALSHYLGLAMSLGEKAGGEGGAEAIACLTPEAANIEVAILQGLDESAAETAIRAALGFGEFARFAGLGITTALERAANAAQTQGAIDLTAWCFYRLGDIALRRSDDDTARTHYEAARPLYQRVGDLLGEANCIRGLGDIALRRSDDDTARTHFDAALAIYERIPEPYSIGWAHRRLARIAEDDERRRHVGAAKEAWQSIGRGDLMAELIEEFGGE